MMTHDPGSVSCGSGVIGSLFHFARQARGAGAKSKLQNNPTQSRIATKKRGTCGARRSTIAAMARKETAGRGRAAALPNAWRGAGLGRAAGAARDQGQDPLI